MAIAISILTLLQMPKRLKTKGDKMPVWRTRPIEEQGTLTLTDWKVVELPGGDRHLVGYCLENREGRVSSVIREFDPCSLQAKTGTGRVYTLHGRPGINVDAEYVWGRWAGVNAISSWTDVADLAWNEHLAAVKAPPSVYPRSKRQSREGSGAGCSSGTRVLPPAAW